MRSRLIPWPTRHQDARFSAPSDGSTWFHQANVGAWYLHDILWTGSELVTVGEGTEYHLGFPDGLLFSSPDGLVWAKHGTEAPFALTCLDVFNGGLLVGGSGGYLLAGPSPNNLPIVNSGAAITGAVWTGSKFFAVSDRGTIMQSVDGVDWTESHSHVSVSFDRLATSGSAYAALGGFGAPTDIYYSPDGSLWSHVLAFQGIILKDITWGGGTSSRAARMGPYFFRTTARRGRRNLSGIVLP